MKHAFLGTVLAAALIAGTPLMANAKVERVEQGALVMENIPAIDPAVRESLRRYGEVRSHGFSGWTADGGVLIATRFGEVAQVHRVDVPMGARRQLTFYDEPVNGGALNPKGDAFVFSKDSGGDEFFQAWHYDLSSGDVTQLSEPGTRNGSAQWTDDGTRLAWYRSQSGDGDWDVLVSDLANPSARKVVLEGSGAMFPLDWSDDGKTLLIGRYVSITKSHLYTLDLASGTLTEIAPQFDVSFGGGEFTADGQHILTTIDKDSEFSRLVKLNIKTSEFDVLSGDIAWDVEGFDIAPNGRDGVFTTNSGGVSEIFKLDLVSGKVTKGPSLGSGVASGLQFDKAGKRVGMTFNSAKSPGDVYSFDYETGAVTRWTMAETGGLNTEHFVEPTLISYTNGDGMQIPAFVYKPKGEGPFPVVISIHGGPEAQSRSTFSSTYQYWVNELGLAVVVPNVRGSSGYGKTYVALDNGFNRKKSVEDIGALIDWVAAEPDLDGERVVVYGGSYGGYMVLASMVDYADKLIGGVNIVGISNFVTFLENTQGYRRDLRRVEYGDERDPAMRAFLQDISPLNHADKIVDPLFIIQGLNDPRVPASEAEQILAAMRGNDAEAWYLLAKNEGHGFAKKSNRDFMNEAIAMYYRHVFGLDG
jgi:dipeptidyl aminopeptidase/acylaminoacyl peptidase